jgi:hypothetical protein
VISKEIVELIQRKGIPAKITDEQAFDRLAQVLQGLFVHQHGNEVG